MRNILFILTVSVTTLLMAGMGAAEVRLGKNVRIGGHDASNQTFNKKNKGRYYIYKGKPKKAGCRWRKSRDGTRTKICHLQRKKKR